MDNKGSEFSNRSNKPWLQDNDTEIYSTHKEGESAVGKRFIATLKKIFTNVWLRYYKHMYINKLDDVINK